jgi:hypothetical protein
MYIAWLCYPRAYDDEYKVETKIEFEEPERWKYSKVIPIQFSVLHQWSNKDKELYR